MAPMELRKPQSLSLLVRRDLVIDQKRAFNHLLPNLAMRHTDSWIVNDFARIIRRGLFWNV